MTGGTAVVGGHIDTIGMPCTGKVSVALVTGEELSAAVVLMLSNLLRAYAGASL